MRDNRMPRWGSTKLEGAGSQGVVVLLLALASAAAAFSTATAESGRRDRFDAVVIDAGHGGKDEGATSPRGLVEKELVLDVTQRLARRLREGKLRVVLTRDDDVFVPLESRTSLANDARGDLFISIHANSARNAKPRGIETFFVSLEASDESARQVAERENQAFGADGVVLSLHDPLAAILGDMAESEHVAESDAFARLAQTELRNAIELPSRGVKQAPFVVLMGVRMPATLIEIGFLSNSEDERILRTGQHRERIAEALAEAVFRYGERYDALRGIGGELSLGSTR
ncbi:MAG: N-acetylmuramoyl-L-alanine amidase [Deltaproteobacteria bacterium]|nr:N-acetylmuramoyl-L-alanine amidase [Deltaproteobacteria bacterium]MBW2419339.1 N-acetylmuramoyl-L-alanine amidase [Deltaproteobacteria bacterium]